MVKGTSSYTIAGRSSGVFFGEISILIKTPRTATIIADDTVLVVKVNKEMFDSLGTSIRDKIKDSIIIRLA
ncbi:MAG: cyclic nucleotide-binding domain-containing protein [Planctomycetia bacterium]|uniref:cyclic nucleotide-binding domain-containing protein n=1 Tax=Candidatus Kuenenia sp. TaxID=2499824 RepID=UPI001E1977DC|nr:cyclic nucleotide-binding domain-containing protein [Planctomycetia bacterium]